MLGSSLHVNRQLYSLNYLFQQNVEVHMERGNPLDLPQCWSRQRKQQKQTQEGIKLHTTFNKREVLEWLEFKVEIRELW